ncbi:DUF3742 family protein [Pseudomonas fluorescens BBc6R8]|uniref:DUF3742 family protein n=1 Tax=Pseudomonas fluorescens TaxID=294 RepID=UPI000281CA39|nr:DUF3742 family protein [Pseudomonas fluorescens]QQD55342.1 DUF3742 family protein [Pseudomonas fluorescens BBc6R8]
MDKKGFAHRAGYRLGRLLKASTRREALIVKWLAVKGVPTVVAATMIWIVKLLLLGTLLYFVFWLGLLLIGLFVFGAFLRPGPNATDSVVGFDGDKLFPDHKAPQNSNDPKYD